MLTSWNIGTMSAAFAVPFPGWPVGPIFPTIASFLYLSPIFPTFYENSPIIPIFREGGGSNK